MRGVGGHGVGHGAITHAGLGAAGSGNRLDRGGDASTSRCCPNRRWATHCSSSTSCAAPTCWRACGAVRARPAWPGGCWMPRASPFRPFRPYRTSRARWRPACSPRRRRPTASRWLVHPLVPRGRHPGHSRCSIAPPIPLAPDRHCAGCRAQGAYRGQWCLTGSAQRAPAGPPRLPAVVLPGRF